VSAAFDFDFDFDLLFFAGCVASDDLVVSADAAFFDAGASGFDGFKFCNSGLIGFSPNCDVSSIYNSRWHYTGHQQMFTS